MRTKNQRYETRMMVAELAMKGHSGEEISRRLNADPRLVAAGVTMSPETVRYDLATLRDQWKNQAMQDTQVYLREQLLKIDVLEKTYWAEYERSQLDAQSETVVENQGGATFGGDGLRPPKRTVTKKTAGRLGEASFLAGVQWCITARIRLLGLAKVADDEGRGKTGTNVQFSITIDSRRGEEEQAPPRVEGRPPLPLIEASTAYRVVGEDVDEDGEPILGAADAFVQRGDRGV